MESTLNRRKTAGPSATLRSGRDLLLTLPLPTVPLKTLRNLGKGEVRGLGTSLIPPQLENATVTERDELALADAERLRSRVDPFARTFEFRIYPQRRFVENTMAPPVCPFRAPFFINK